MVQTSWVSSLVHECVKNTLRLRALKYFNFNPDSAVLVRHLRLLYMYVDQCLNTRQQQNTAYALHLFRYKKNVDY